MPVEIVLVALDDRRDIARFPAVLRRAGVKVTLLGNCRVSMAWSRFVDRKIPCGSEPLGLSMAMRVIIHKNDSPPWLICCDDAALAAVAECRGEDWLDRMFPVDHRGPMVDAMFQKSAFAASASDSLPLAPWAVCTSVTEASEAADKFGFPVVLHRDTDRGGVNSIFVTDPKGITAAWWSLADAGCVLVQKQIEGHAGSTDILFHRGRPVCWSSWFSGRAGRALDPQIDDILTQLGKLTAFQGFCGIEWMRDRAGKFHVLRFRATPTPGIMRGQYNGVNFSRALWELFHGMLRIQKPFAAPTGTMREKFSALTRLPWNDPGLLVRSFLKSRA